MLWGARAFLVARWSGAWRMSPGGWRPTILHVSVRRYRCPEVCYVWRQDMSPAADPRASSARSGALALTGVVVRHVTLARSPRPWACPGRAANTAVLAEGARLLINDPARCEGCVSLAWMNTCGATPRMG